MLLMMTKRGRRRMTLRLAGLLPTGSALRGAAGALLCSLGSRALHPAAMDRPRRAQAGRLHRPTRAITLLGRP